MIAVAPNGARKTRRDHPQLPITPAQLAVTAAECQAAGACLLHLHVRDERGEHSLHPEHYKPAIAAIQDAVGDALIIQITTEAVGRYAPAAQMQTVRDIKPEAVSLAIRELCPTAADEAEAAGFFHWLEASAICPQYILYSAADIARFQDLQSRDIIPASHTSVLLVLGRYTDGQHSDPAALAPLLRQLDTRHNWWLCAFGATESTCMQQAITHGGHCRVGFENNLLLPDGSTASDNAVLVQGIAQLAAAAGRDIASPAAARQILGIG